MHPLCWVVSGWGKVAADRWQLALPQGGMQLPAPALIAALQRACLPLPALHMLQPAPPAMTALQQLALQRMLQYKSA